jgi:hypothetical protein
VGTAPDDQPNEGPGEGANRAPRLGFDSLAAAADWLIEGYGAGAVMKPGR